MTLPTMAQNDTILVWLHTEPDNGALLIQPFASSQTPTTVRYQLSSQKTGKSGTASNRQSGSKQIGPVPIALASLRLGLHDGDQLQIKVHIFHNHALIQTLYYP